MKKLLVRLFSVIMAVSLAVPAFAAPAPGDAGSIGIVGGADGPTSIAVNEPIDDSWGCVSEDEYLAAHPGLEEQLRANAYDYFAQEHPWYESAQEYMEDFGITEEEFIQWMVWDQVWDLLWEEEQQRQADAQKEAMGGVPGQVGVMVNGGYIQFPDAAPEVTNGRTMTPVRALIEALGGGAEMVDDKVICKMDGISLTFTLGSQDVKVEQGDGGSGVVSMDCAPYIKDGRTYVPVRFIGEALGYTVGWDSGYQTAVLTDADALAAQIDQGFAIYNRVLANQACDLEAGKNYRADIKGDMTFTAFDTLNGDTTYTASLTGQELFNAGAVNGGYTLTMSGNLADLLVELLEGQGLPGGEAEPLRTALQELELSYIMTREGLLWVRSPLLDQYGDAENIWCGLGIDMDAAAAAFDGMGAATMGGAYAAMLDPDSALSWRDTAAMAQMAAAILGDGCFAAADGVSTLKWDVDKLLDQMLGDLPEEAMDETVLDGLREELSKRYKEFDITLTVDQQGNAKLYCLVHTLPQGFGEASMRVEMECALSAGAVSMSADVHVANMGQLKLALSASRQAAVQQPAVEPPEGSTVVDPAGLLGSGSVE